MIECIWMIMMLLFECSLMHHLFMTLGLSFCRVPWYGWFDIALAWNGLSLGTLFGFGGDGRLFHGSILAFGDDMISS